VDVYSCASIISQLLATSSSHLLQTYLKKVFSKCLFQRLYYSSFARDVSLALALKILDLTKAVGSDSGEMFLGAGLCSCEGIVCLISEKEIRSCIELVSVGCI